ncbi:UDP-N-acetylmuramoyl-L-alanyl-D-glutamate--2,6-diaminopimelate ligase [Garciella nitratireducens]|uniref:UDP-N-acetylmuramoyl-L-alanyl-D-glutamate--2,6-diaminopimelate ligase n=1 Tax=Garciella nitratireducens DSM 15102 TaxID=1121911 RepID=A0A1T4M8A8_9FIRM|nr:UDP-N-acetylmuramoyl-L-alanyl-D-glutamate--2,6-diaminopimelate ligase [Garciella nitratireducens]SJZ62934.1 UDP-N-acetylmuramoylalanyl-D-glutamate--2,6-diaminopimelate ligase [Garciella nitratireducens DSM 15102]
MNLKHLIDGIDIISYKGSLDKEILEITYDSRKCSKNCIYIARKGFQVDGHDYIPSAIKNGAICIICEKEIPILKEGITYIQVKDSKIAQAELAIRFYDHPSEKLKMIGITGTNGKTSISFLIGNILRQWGKKTGTIGTIGNYIGNSFYKANNTTPEAIDLQKFLSEMVKQKVDYGIMEVSSHSLALNRVRGVKYAIGIFTNLSQDHLDFHKTYEDYFQAKAKLFDMTYKANIINGDDPYGERLLRKLKDKEKVPTYSYGIKNNNCDFLAKDIQITHKGVSFILEGENLQEDFSIGIPGIFSVYNAMTAIIVALLEKVPISIIKEALEKTPAVPGRFEVINTHTPYSVIIDYAHTPDGLENVLKTIRSFAKNRIISVFGCGGNRDKTKRPIMGEIGGTYSDLCILTSDNPRNEDPLTIIQDILPGIQKTNCPYQVIENRKEAIKRALEMAQKDDVILIAGKGHETYQILKDKTISFDEKKIVKELLEQA